MATAVGPLPCWNLGYEPFSPKQVLSVTKL